MSTKDCSVYPGTAAQLLPESDPKPIAKVVGSRAYQSYFRDTLASEGKRIQRFAKWYIQQNSLLVAAPADTHGPVAAKVIFVDTLEAIKEATATALGQAVETATIGWPRHFNDSSRVAVMEAAEDVETSLEPPWQTVEFPFAVRLAYGLDSCVGFALVDSDDCDIDEGPHYIVYAEYHEGYLGL